MVAYLRCADDNDERQQTKEFRRYARSVGLRIATFYADHPTCAWRHPTLAGLTKMLDDKWDLVMVRDPKELLHPGTDLNAIEEIAETKRRILRVGDPVTVVVPQDRPSRELSSDSREIGRRLARGRRDSVKKGRKGGGPAPFGYTRKQGVLVVRPEEAEVVRKIFAQYMTLKSIYKVAEWLQQGGYRTRLGSEFSRPAVHWILKNRTYVGRVKCGDVEAQGHHRPIISWIQFNLAQRMMSKNRRNKGN